MATLAHDKERIRKAFPHFSEEQFETWIFTEDSEGILKAVPPYPKPGTIGRVGPLGSERYWKAGATEWVMMSDSEIIAHLESLTYLEG